MHNCPQLGAAGAASQPSQSSDSSDLAELDKDAGYRFLVHPVDSWTQAILNPYFPPICVQISSNFVVNIQRLPGGWPDVSTASFNAVGLRQDMKDFITNFFNIKKTSLAISDNLSGISVRRICKIL